MQNPKELIIEKLKWILGEMGVVDTNPEVSLVTEQKFGDFTSNVAMVTWKGILVLKQEKKDGFWTSQNDNINSPRELAEKLVLKLQESEEVNQVFDKIEVAGPGFINIHLSSKYLSELLQEITQNGSTYGTSNNKSGQTVIVEYSSPNIAKPFTVGHLRSTIIGDAIANLLETQGYTVKRDNHLGDWGSQFGKQIYAIKTWGNMEEIERSENPVKDLVALYVKFHEEAEKDPTLEDKARGWFKKLEEGDSEARELWKKCIAWSMKEFERIYGILGVKFTENEGRGFGESFFEDKMQSVIDELESKGLLTEDQGAKLVYFPEDKYPPLMILKKDGTTLYATRDLATDKFRLEAYPGATIINEVGIEQELYFKQLFEVEKMLGWVKEGQRVHIKHGHYRFAEGKMSTRKGNVIWLEDVLREAETRASKLSEETNLEENAQAVAVGAIKWNDLRRDSKQDITFDWDDILNMQGNSGPYLQYTYVRTQSVLGKADSVKGKGESEGSRHSGYDSERSVEENIRITLNSGQARMTDSLETEESELLRFLAQYPYYVAQATEEFAPNVVCNYLFELSQKFNLFYQKHSILNPVIASEAKQSIEEIKAFRLHLTQAVGQVLKNGLTILGIETVEKM